MRFTREGFQSDAPLSRTFTNRLAPAHAAVARLVVSPEGLGRLKPKPTEISIIHVMEVCRLGQSAACCAFLLGVPWACAKGTPYGEILADQLKAGTLRSRGDNCSGPPVFNAIKENQK